MRSLMRSTGRFAATMNAAARIELEEVRQCSRDNFDEAGRTGKTNNTARLSETCNNDRFTTLSRIQCSLALLIKCSTDLSHAKAARGAFDQPRAHPIFKLRDALAEFRFRNMADGGTIELRIRISQSGGESARCKDPRAWGQRNDFSPFTEQCTTTSTSSVISRQPRRIVPSEPRPCRCGMKLSRSRDGCRPIKLVRMFFSNVTMPS
jgi:hypothetical protein